MTWLTWRQLRASVLAVALALVALFILLWISGTQLLHVYDTVIVRCGTPMRCGPEGAHFEALGHLRHAYSILLLAAPVLVGVFWGAPLVARELESGTYRLAWTQSVTRLRWIMVRLAIAAAVVVVVMGLLSTAVTWWQSPLDRFNVTGYSTFETRNVVPVAYAVFGVALGALLGAVMRGTLAAMAATIVAFGGVRYLIAQYVRPNLLTPLTASRPLRVTLTSTGAGFTISPPAPGAWVLSDQYVTRSGAVVGSAGIPASGSFVPTLHRNGVVSMGVGLGNCGNRIPLIHHLGRSSPGPGFQAALQRCVDAFRVREVVTYQPLSRYWPLQWSEAAIYVALAIALGAACVWFVRRRLP